MIERILDIIKKHHTLSKIAAAAKMNKKSVLDIIRKLIKDNKVISDGDKIYPIYQGKIEITNERFGFITPLNMDDNTKDFYVSHENFNDAFDSDIVLFYVYKDRNLKMRANVIKVLEHTKIEVVGTFRIDTYKNKKYYSVVSLDYKDSYNLVLDPNVELFKGAIIKCELVYTEHNVKARFIELIGYKDDPGVEIAAIAAVYGFNKDFPIEVKDEVEKEIPSTVNEAEIIGRKDFRDLPIITIDGDDSKDFDDAIYVKKEEDGTYTLGVYIADVSNYVKDRSPLDKEAYHRGTSVYLADRVIPMLPRELSNGICSLNEGVDRLVLAIVMKVDGKGKCVDSNLVEGVIRSRHRMTYNNVNKMLNGEEETISKYQDIYQMLLEANELHHIVRKKREAAGSLDFDIDEYSFILNEDGSPKDIIKRTRFDAEKLIEDFMILANEEVAKYMTRLDLPFLYRIHDKPSEEKIAEFLNLVGEKKIKTDREIRPKQVQDLLKSLEEKPDSNILNQLLLRSMAKAKYSEDNIGHYGLALKNYCHFTSPIRRYPDLIVHRIIKELILHPTNYNKALSYYANHLQEIGLSTSTRERNAIACERDVNDMLYAWYMEGHKNEEFMGIISSMTKFGFFVTIDKGVEGLVREDSLQEKFYFDEKNMKYISKYKTYSLGDKVRVKVLDSNRRTRKIDFELSD